mmetsp:Transcript_16793/g.54193  ORF Transcript_16793/g.54193 Transcript_16793/m.54193 type:complete len:321 (+) Transcript_16793:1230-2192(+)
MAGASTTSAPNLPTMLAFAGGLEDEAGFVWVSFAAVWFWAQTLAAPGSATPVFVSTCTPDASTAAAATCTPAAAGTDGPSTTCACELVVVVVLAAVPNSLCFEAPSREGATDAGNVVPMLFSPCAVGFAAAMALATWPLAMLAPLPFWLPPPPFASASASTGTGASSASSSRAAWAAVLVVGASSSPLSSPVFWGSSSLAAWVAVPVMVPSSAPLTPVVWASSSLAECAAAAVVVPSPSPPSSSVFLASSSLAASPLLSPVCSVSCSASFFCLVSSSAITGLPSGPGSSSSSASSFWSALPEEPAGLPTFSPDSAVPPPS